jgi:succinyl-CoA synthetase beta subunit
MTKIWAKIVTDHKVKCSIVFDAGEIITHDHFYNAVQSICEELKIPTPVVLKSYGENFLEYNIVKFRARDFVEDIRFDTLVLENAE